MAVSGRKARAKARAEAKARFAERQAARGAFIGPRRPLRTITVPADNRELIALNVLARDPVTGEHYIAHVPAGNPRAVGRYKMGREAAALAVRDPWSGPPELDCHASMRAHLDDIADMVDEAIADDNKAGLLMRTIGAALGCIVMIARTDGAREPNSRLWEKELARQIGTKKGVEANQARAAEWWDSVIKIWKSKRGQRVEAGEKRISNPTQETLAKDLVEGRHGKIPGLPGFDQVLNTIKVWEADLRKRRAAAYSFPTIELSAKSRRPFGESP